MPSRGLNLARISNRPYSQENLPRVVREAEVYSASFRVVCQFFPSGSLMGVGMFFLPAFNNQHAVFAIGVFRLVPLRFLVADETVFVIPFGRVRTAVFVEFVVPDEFIIGIIRFSTTLSCFLTPSPWRV